MKRFLFSIFCIGLIFLLTGCESSKTERAAILTHLKRQGIVSKNYKHADSVSICSAGMEVCHCTKYHIYKDSDSNMIAIHYEKGSSNADYDHYITIYYDVTPNIPIVYYAPDEETDCWEKDIYKDNDDKKMKYNSYNFDKSKRKTYEVKIEKVLIFSKYKFIENSY